MRISEEREAWKGFHKYSSYIMGNIKNNFMKLFYKSISQFWEITFHSSFYTSLIVDMGRKRFFNSRWKTVGFFFNNCTEDVCVFGAQKKMMKLLNLTSHFSFNLRLDSSRSRQTLSNCLGLSTKTKHPIPMYLQSNKI